MTGVSGLTHGFDQKREPGQRRFWVMSAVSRMAPRFHVGFLAGVLLFPVGGPFGLAAAPEPAEDHFIAEVWQVENGLPANTVTSVAQTTDGYLWVGTDGGLARFDGVRFHVFDARTPGLGNRQITKLFADREGGLWVAMLPGQLARFFEEKFTVFHAADGWSMNEPLSFVQCRNGDVLAADATGAVHRFHDGRFSELVPSPAGPHERHKAWTQDAAGDQWALNVDRKLSLRRGNLWELFVPVGDSSPPTVEKLAARQQGGLWILGEHRVRLLENGRWIRDYDVMSELAPGSVLCFKEDASGYLWVGTSKSQLFRLAPDGSRQAFSPQNGLPQGGIVDICEDREGNFWLASSEGGLVRLKRAAFQTLGSAQGLPPQAVLCLAEDSFGRLMLGTRGGGMFVMENQRIFGPLALSGVPLTIGALRKGRSGALWVGTQGGGLLRLHGQNSRQWTTRDGLIDLRIMSLYEDRAGALWIGTESGLSHFDGQRFTNYATGEGLSDNHVHAITQDPAGNLWVGTTAGLNRLHDGKFTSFFRRDGLASDYVRALLADTSGILWVGTLDGGLSRFSEGRFVNYSVNDGLPDNSITTIVDDGLGFLWLGTTRGICRVARAELEKFAQGTRNPIGCTTYLKTDGLASIQCSEGNPPGILTQDGRLWFATLRGVSEVDPRQIRPNPVPPPVVIEEVLINGAVVLSNRRADAASKRGGPPRALSVPPGGRHVEIAYTGLSLTSPSQARFRIRMEGFDDGWRDVGPRRVAYYDGLPPGRYRFRVLAANNDGIWNEVGASLPLAVMPYFWQTWWFRGTAALGLAGSILFWVRRRIVRREHERATEALRENHLLIESLLRTIPYGVEIVDEQGRILFLNEPTEKLIGPGQLGKTCWQVYKDDRQQCAHCPLREPVEVGVTRTVETRGALGGRVFLISHTGMIFQGRKAMLKVFQDITARKEAQKKLQMLEQQTALEAERARIARDMHDELGAALTRITLLGEMIGVEMANENQAATGKGNALLQRITALARQAVESMDEIVWAANPRNDTLEDFADYVCHFAEELLKLSPVQCRMEVPSVMPPKVLGAEVRHHLFLVVKEALNNLVKHSGASQATLSMQIESDTLTVVIADDGRGFDVDQRSQAGNGLGNMRQRIKTVGGLMELSSEPGAGTRITLRIGLETNGRR